jgi:hypothetical protein
LRDGRDFTTKAQASPADFSVKNGRISDKLQQAVSSLTTGFSRHFQKDIDEHMQPLRRRL